MKRIIKNRGLNRHARALGVSNGHLSAVISGIRSSPELLARYREMVAQELLNPSPPDPRWPKAPVQFRRGDRFSVDPEQSPAIVAELSIYCRQEGDQWVVQRQFTAHFPALAAAAAAPQSA